MRGYLQPAVKSMPSDVQNAFAALARHRRSKLSKAAQTTLVKAHQWARGGAVSAEVAAALEAGVKTLRDKQAKKKK